MPKRFEVVINQEHCKSCGVCIAFCPRQVLGVSETRNSAGFQPVEVRKPDECTGCTQCAIMCPDACIEVYRVTVTDDPVAAEESVKR